ncbi:MAG TPA: hypothetical protein VJB98_01580 [Candidatus Paceibacterota bacterium]
MDQVENVKNEELIRQIQKPERKVARPKRFKFLAILIVLILALLVTNYAYQYFGYYTISEQAIHWHAHLIIRDKGKYVPIPASVGLLRDTAHPENLHTHSDDNIIHMEIEGPVRARQVMLGAFFGVWGEDFGNPVSLLVNGSPVSAGEDYVMHDGDEIELNYE